MIEEAKRLPPSMVTVGIVFVSMFFVLSLGTIVAVMADDTPPTPDLAGLPTIPGSEVVASISTCTDSACDGHGVLLMRSGFDTHSLTESLSNLWRSRGWHSVDCIGKGDHCLADDDLRISVRNWDQVNPALAPTLVGEVADRELDGSQLLYVHYYRCGTIYPCQP